MMILIDQFRLWHYLFRDCKLMIEDFKKSSCGRIVVISSFVNKSIGLNNKFFQLQLLRKVL